MEGSIAGIFRLRVQPAEIGRRLERAMLDGRVTSVGTSCAPNLYEVRCILRMRRSSPTGTRR